MNSPRNLLPAERPPLFLGGHLALDFLNSHATPDGQPVEWIGSGAAFAHWYRQAGLARSPEASARLAVLRLDELDALAAEARALREAVRAGLRATPNARLDPPLWAVLNRWMAAGSCFRRIERADGEVSLTVHERCDDAEQLLVPLATATAQLLVDEDLSRIRVCDGPTCSLWFLDRTKAGTRRFCSPATCGNRTKVAAFRARERALRKVSRPR